MRCSVTECESGRRFAAGSVYCRVYGMIIREGHECRLKGARQRDRAESDRDGGEEGAGLQEDSAGAAGRLQIVL